ncbi:MAG: hypothetical protein MI742_09455 [Desulfobacterales bacterium]|nr:hypothetical protein [Desulfobacterales bacterium]
MHPFTTIFKAHPTLTRVFLIKPDESVFLAVSKTGEKCPPPPLKNLNHLFHDACHLTQDTHYLRLAFGDEQFTTTRLPHDWVLVAEHSPKANEAMIKALVKVARDIPKPDVQEHLLILTPERLLAGPLGPHLKKCRHIFEKAGGTEVQPKTFAKTLNRWIDTEEPCNTSLARLFCMLESEITSVDKRRIFSHNVKKFIPYEHKKEKMP